MATGKLAAALALLAAGAAVGAAAYASTRAGPGATGAFDVEVVGPDGPVLSATVEVEDATALSALQAAAARAGVDVRTERYPGMGVYVRAIGPHAASGPSGWIYEVRRDGAWTGGDRSAASFPLQPGDALRWRWTEG